MSTTTGKRRAGQYCQGDKPTKKTRFATHSQASTHHKHGKKTTFVFKPKYHLFLFRLLRLLKANKNEQKQTSTLQSKRHLQRKRQTAQSQSSAQTKTTFVFKPKQHLFLFRLLRLHKANKNKQKQTSTLQSKRHLQKKRRPRQSQSSAQTKTTIVFKPKQHLFLFRLLRLLKVNKNKQKQTGTFQPKCHLFPYRLLRLMSSPLIPLPSSIPFSNIHCIGGTLPRHFSKKWDFSHVPSTLASLPSRRRPHSSNRQKLYLFFSSESLDPNHDSVRRSNDENVPILNVICSDEVPTVLVSRYSLQHQHEVIRDMSHVGLQWVRCQTSNVYYLKSFVPLDWKESEFLQLYLRRPSDVKKDYRRDSVGRNVTMKYKGVDLLWDFQSECLDEMVNESIHDEDILSSGDESELKKQLIMARKENEAMMKATAKKKTLMFDDMIDDIASEGGRTRKDVLTSLEEMTAYKIYPTGDERLDPIVSRFGYCGFRKNRMVNRYFGNAEKFF